METLTAQQFLTDEQFKKFIGLDFSYELDLNGDNKQLFIIQVGFEDESWIDINGTVDVYGGDIYEVSVDIFQVVIDNDIVKFTTEQYNNIINKIEFTF